MRCRVRECLIDTYDASERQTYVDYAKKHFVDYNIIHFSWTTPKNIL